MNHVKIKFSKPAILLFIILGLAAVLRFYQLPFMVGFDFDQEYAANFAHAVLREYPIQLIGQGLSVEGLFMGPLYFYYLVPFFAVTNLHPIGGYAGSVVLGLATVITYYVIFRNVFSEKAGLVAAFLRAFLFTFIERDWYMIPSLSSELAIILTWYFIYKYWKNNFYYLIPLSFALGLYTSFHPIQLPFCLVVIFIILLKRKLPKAKVLFLSAISFILPLTPLIIFEYFHSFLEIKLLLFGLGESAKAEPKDLTTLLSYIETIFRSLNSTYGLNTIKIPELVLPISILVIFGWLTYKKKYFWKDKFHITFILLSSLIFIFYYLTLPTHVPDYYFSGLVTIFFIYSVASLSLIRKSLIIPILIFLLALNIWPLINKWNDKNLITLAHKDNIVKEIVKREGTNSIRVTYIVDPGWGFGFSYLFKYYGKNPVGPGGSPEYKIFLPKSITTEKFDITSGNIGLILPKK